MGMGGKTSKREVGLARRHFRIRKKVSGSPERPRLVVHRSHLHMQAQIVDDTAGKTLVSCSTNHPDFIKAYKKGGNVEAAKRLGEMVAEAAKKSGISKVVFDRGGYPFHGRVKALTEAARAKGLEV